jgi:hypothetical protein
VVGGLAPYTFTLIPGPVPPFDTAGLPPGLTLKSTTGAISGTAPLGEGTWAATVEVADSESPPQLQQITIMFQVGVPG